MIIKQTIRGVLRAMAPRETGSIGMSVHTTAAAMYLLLAIGAVAAALMPREASAQTLRVVKPIADRTLGIDSGVHVIDLRGIYWGAPLECDAVSSDESVAIAQVVGGVFLHITPVGVGETTITASAWNEDSRVEHDFLVKIIGTAPAAVGKFPDLEMTVGDALPVELSGGFSGEGLSYAAASSAEGTASVEVAGATATVSALAAGEATITVTAANGAGTAEQTIAVRVVEAPPVAVGGFADLEMAVGEALPVELSVGFSGGGLSYAAVSSAEGTASVEVAGATATVSALAAGEATVTVTAANGAGTAEQSFAVRVVDAPPVAVGELADLEMTVGDAPVEVEVSGAFSGAGLAFSVASSMEGVAGVSLEGSVVSVSAGAAGAATVRVLASNSAGTAEQSFAVTVSERPPMAGSLPDIALTAGGEAAMVDAGSAFTGTNLIYSVENAGDAVGVALAGDRLTVTPLMEGEAKVTVTASNSAGTASTSFRATVTTDAAEHDALENTVAAIARGTLASVNSAIGGRFRAERTAPSTGGDTHSLVSLGSPVVNPVAGLSQSGMQLRHFDGMGFAIPMNAADSGTAWVAPAEWTFWGHVDRQSFDGEGYDGDLTSLYVGADANFGDTWLAGVAVSRSAGNADYEFMSADANGGGDIDTEMVSVLPYVRWSVGKASEVWAIAGAGWGDIELERTAAVGESDADLSMWMLSVGGRHTLNSGDVWNVGLTGDAGLLEMQTDGGVGIVDDMNVSVSRIKLALEGEYLIFSGSGETLSVFGQMGGRHDAGDGDTGSGVELLGGMRFSAAERLTIEAQARLLSLHSGDDYNEHGLSLSAIVQPRADGSGMSLAISSYLGSALSANNLLPEQGYGYPGRIDEFGAETDAWGLDARIGYALPVERLSGLLTPFANFDMAGDDGHGLRMGLRYDAVDRGAGTILNLELTGGREYDRWRREAHSMVRLRGELRF